MPDLGRSDSPTEEGDGRNASVRPGESLRTSSSWNMRSLQVHRVPRWVRFMDILLRRRGNDDWRSQNDRPHRSPLRRHLQNTEQRLSVRRSWWRSSVVSDCPRTIPPDVRDRQGAPLARTLHLLDRNVIDRRVIDHIDRLAAIECRIKLLSRHCLTRRPGELVIRSLD